MNIHNDIKFIIASSEPAFDDAGNLFQEYARGLDYDAGFQNFVEELATLNELYTKPNGGLILAYKENTAVGCIAIRKVEQETAELKRFYVQPAFRQYKIGARLLESAIDYAKQLQFQHLRLEVIPSLKKAKELYRSFGFHEITPYQKVSLEGTAYMEKNL